METDYGYVRYMYETDDMTTIYVYDITDTVVRAAVLDERPYIALIRQAKSGRPYFTRNKKKIFIDELEEVNVF